MAQISADKVTDEILANIINKTKDAIKKGDETLKGDAGTGILDKLDGNVAKNPNASDKTKQEATDAEKEVDVNKEPAQTTPSAKTDNAKTDNNAGSQSSNNGSSNSGSASSKPSKPAHTHTWVNHTATRQVWVSNWLMCLTTRPRQSMADNSTRNNLTEHGSATERRTGSTPMPTSKHSRTLSSKR